MLTHYLRMAFRMFRRNRLYSLINIGCLSIGIAAALTILMYVFHEHSYDRWQVNGNRIFEVSADYTFGSSTYSSNRMSHMTGPLVQQADPRVRAFVRAYQLYEQPILQRAEMPEMALKVKEPFLFCDSNFFQVFSYRLLRGDAARVLSRPGTIVLSARAARQYFGKDDPIGKGLLYKDSVRLEVTGIAADPPSNTSIRFDAVASFSTLRAMNDPNLLYGETVQGGNFITWFLLKEPADSAKVAGTINRLAAAPSPTKWDSKDNYKLTRLTDTHLQGMFFDTANIKYLQIFPLVAGLILLLALVNYMSLATARAAVRAREVGVRKVMGAGRASLAGQFYIESTVYAVLAFICGLGLFLLFRPWFLQLLELRIDGSFVFSPFLLVCYAALLIVVIFFSGGYPSLVLSAFKPVAVLYGKLSRSRSGERVRKGFLIFQFSISMGLIISTLIIQKEMYFIRHADTGINRENVVMIPFDSHLAHYQAFRQEVEKIPGVLAVAISDFSLYGGYVTYMVTPKGTAKPFALPVMHVDKNFASLLQMRWIREPALNDFYDGKHVLLNESAVASLGLEGNPVGQAVKMYNQFTVAGVLHDFNYEALRGKIGPYCLIADRDSDSAFGSTAKGCMMARVKAHVNLPGIIAALGKAYSTFDRKHPFDYQFLDEVFDSQYKAEDRLAGLMGIFTVITIVIACLGLFALATFAAQQRLKEIGIRKVLGASVASIGALLSRDFLRPVALSVLIASPLAGWVMHRWLENFAYRTSIPWWVFPLAGGGLLLIAQGTVLFRTIRAAQANPTVNLRSE
jgi:putative ABC transport system permease protein